jgi:hypothetical protein
MSMSVMTEGLITVSEAVQELEAATGKRPHKATVHRWMQRGVDGVKLEAVRIGRSVFTSRQSLTRFINQLTNREKK